MGQYTRLYKGGLTFWYTLSSVEEYRVSPRTDKLSVMLR